MPSDDTREIVRSGRIALMAYDPRWPAASEQVREAIRQMLQAIAFDAYHIGSTAIPGLCAKPTIDIDIAPCAVGDVARSVDIIRSNGLTYHGDPYHDGMWTFTSRRDIFPAFRLYVCAPGTPAHLNRVLFRDHLRANPEVAAAYGALKRNLVIESRGDWKLYTGGKSGFVANVVELAMASRAGKP